ncbi:type II secretion system protein GspD [Terriglobus albidus]|uniref:type II secretion system protein GspD n=1 Tax=Terriglobus albidus TaxID=1592106 RepID=UPI0021E05889|nr:type II and III secretion system protein [Terriglobus albidus]
MVLAPQAETLVTLHPRRRRISIHMQAPAQELIRQSFTAFGIGTLFDVSVSNEMIRIDLDDASFSDLRRGLEMLTRTFLVPVAEDRAIVYKDTIENRQHFDPLGYETLNASSLQPDQVVEIQNIAKGLLGIRNVNVETSEKKITLRGSEDRLLLFNETFDEIFRPRGEVVIDVEVYQLARSKTRNIGLQLPQEASVFNVSAEVRKLISDNQSVVNQAISAGLVTSDDTLGIAVLLIEGGYASSSPLGQGFAVFGGGISWSGLSFGTTTLHLALNSSDSRLVDKVQMRVKDGEKGILRNGSRYPIATSQYSSIVTSSQSSTSSSSTVPQVQYEDLGFTLAATPKVHADNVELHLDLTFRNLSGSSLNDMPILTNRQFIGDIAARSGETVALSSSLTVQESKALNGIPGLSELPGFQTASTGGDREKDTEEVLVLVTPHLLRPARSVAVGAQVLLPFRSDSDE